MAYWEFLLQKEGDREWLPLETAHVEISEGRYRIIAHTSYGEVAVDIRLSRVLTEQMPPKRKTLKRSGQTNTDGLMVVMPFTHLTPGSWTIKCAPGSTVESTTQWEYGVQLQVIAVESDLDYWDADADIPISIPPSSAASQDPLPTTSTPSDTGTPVIEAPTGKSQPHMPMLLDAAPLEDLPLRLPLQHQAMVAQQGTELMLKGQVTSFSQVEGLSTEGTLWVQLRDPETGTVVHRESRVLSMSSLPSRFDFPIALPNQGTLRLLVGELSLWSVTHPPQVLAIQGFTITLNLDALLETVANQGEGHNTPFDDLGTSQASPSASEATGSLERDTASDIETLAARDIPFRRVYLPSSGLTLPPVIYRPLDSAALQSPKLPILPHQPLRSREASESTSPAVKSLSLPPIASGTQQAPSAAATNSTPDEGKSTISLPAFQRSHSQSTPDSSAPKPTAEDDKTKVETSALAFKPDFEGRFWSRLSAIADESQRVTANLKAQMEAAGVSSDPSPTKPVLEDAPAPDFPSFKEEVTAASHEVVIYDSELEEGSIIDPLPLSESYPGATASVLSTNNELEDFGTIPIPKLDLPEGDLVAGAPLPITVLLPPYPRRLAVKVWVTDVQSRHLADRPRWLMNWTPVEEGKKMAHLQLQVPQGSLEAQFEAIAIDLATQQESYKTTVARAIVPPNVPASGNENLR
ncbi:MAG: hypothetical protein AAGH78_15850 [Cyanobacteria bacterium P01_H01_bin.58]